MVNMKRCAMFQKRLLIWSWELPYHINMQPFESFLSVSRIESVAKHFAGWTMQKLMPRYLCTDKLAIYEIGS